MLTHITVRNLAVVEDVSVDLETGMTSLTGETGAGKSMLVDALGLVLGDRADTNMIRNNAERAEIEAQFSLSDTPALHDWLLQHELDEDDSCHLRRTISRDGRSKAYINGRAAAISQLRELGALTIDIHGQHAHQSLLRPHTQRAIIDTMANNRPLLNDHRTAYKAWHQNNETLINLKTTATEQQAKVDLLRYQVEEMSSFTLTREYIDDLLQQQTVLANAADLIRAAEAGIDRLVENENGAAQDAINRTLIDLEKFEALSPHFGAAVETLNAALINLDEAVDILRHYLDHADLDPDTLSQIETELTSLHDLARKHHIEIEQLPEHYELLQHELDNIVNADAHLEALENTVAEQKQHCHELAQQLHDRRTKTAKPLAEKITACMQGLAISSGHIQFNIEAVTDKLTEFGFDQVRLMVSTNPGSPAGELGKVASGGELARISLAIQVVTAGQSGVPTLVFDEVDVGIGGGVAEVVGQYLRSLGSHRQVLCITHLAQVAAQAHHQLQVTKVQTQTSAAIRVDKLDTSQRIEEIARMLGGLNLTDKTRLHAEEMLTHAQA
jgi:DNA repair protein RecN (Recombination protein N)